MSGLTGGRYSLTAYPYPTPEDRARGRLFSFERVTGILAGNESVEIVLAPQIQVAGIVVDERGVAVSGAFVAASAKAFGPKASANAARRRARTSDPDAPPTALVGSRK